MLDSMFDNKGPSSAANAMSWLNSVAHHIQSNNLSESMRKAIISDLAGIFHWIRNNLSDQEMTPASIDVDALAAQCWLLVVENHQLRKELESHAASA